MPLSLISLILISLLLLLSTPASTVYEIFPQFGLPSGLLPNTVKTYTLADDGTFSVDLESTCYIKLDYMVYYDKQITGVLKYASITGLKGIQVQRFLVWFGVDEIRVNLAPSDSIYFQVGFINKRLDMDRFQKVRSCDKKGFRPRLDCSPVSSL